MKYIENLIHYIDDHIQEIEMPDHNLYQYCCVSSSKLEKDFKNYAGFTLRNYLIQRKTELIKELLADNKNMDTQDAMILANYNYSDRTLRNHKQTNLSHSELVNMFFLNKRVFSEVLIRLILLLKEVKPKIYTDHCPIIHKVKNKIFQFGNSSGDEEHYYQIRFFLQDQSLRFEHIAILRTTDQENIYVPNDIELYIDLLFTLDDNMSDILGFSLKDAVKGLNTYKITDYSGKVKRWEINRNSEFILQTNSLVDELRTTMFKNCIKKIKRLHNTSFEALQQFARYVEDNNRQAMRDVLESTEYLDKKETLNLIFDTICFPEDIALLVLDPDSPKEIKLLSKRYSREKLIDIIFEYMDIMAPLNDEEKCNFDFSGWLKEKLKLR